MLSLEAYCQYREIVFYKIPVGEVKYFHKDEPVSFKLKSEEKFETRNGSIKLLTDTMIEIGNVRFKPENLQWLSSSFSKPKKFFKTFKCFFQ